MADAIGGHCMSGSSKTPVSGRAVGKLVEVSAGELDEVKRLLRRLTQLDDQPLMAKSSLTNNCVERLRDRATEILVARRQRVTLFGASMFTETAWDLLLILYLAQPGHRQTISSLALASGSSKSTVIRWFAYLEQRKFAKREPHPTDKRAAFVSLAERGHELMNVYLAGTLRSGD
jgi:DNA-binding MarR family transcriptional regulator